MSDIPARIARRAIRKLPDPVVARIRSARTERSYGLNTRGITANPEMVAWFAAHARPVSIVIPSYNDVPLLTAALASIEETCRGAEYEVIIVDDFIDPQVSEQLKQLESDRVTVVLKDRRLGFAGTVNVGMQLARHDIILLNSDIVAKPGWLEALQYSAYALDPAIGMVSPKLVYPDGRIQYAGTYYARLLAPQWFGHLHVGSPATKPTANVAGYNRSISGACVYITREAFDRVGLLDDEFWLGFEDVDYGLRAWGRGIRCFYQPAAMLVHHESASRGYSQGQRELASMRRFWRRWEDEFLARRRGADAPVDLVVGPASDAPWRRYVEALAAALAADGRVVAVREADGPGPDDALVAELGERRGIAVACDEGAAETVWLASTAGSLPVYLLPAVESIRHPHDVETQSRIIAGYRPEFDYIAPNRWTAAQLQAEAAWETRRRIPPALEPDPLPEAADDVVVTIGAGPAERRVAEAAAAGPGARAVHLESGASPVEVAALKPRAVVDLVEHQSSLEPFALMSCGAVYLAPVDGRLAHEVLDGYNALLFSRGDLDQLRRSLDDALGDDAVWTEIRHNGHASATRAAGAAARAFADALLDFSQSPI
ncbi:glycosyltransferase family 2 protein [Microbacterium atlanticum]|uniref:glycosyltransferase family 2 protein n=1 Tax=Microbacterium atlanticum TaxID=2782168 RepID=UPI001886E51D|nr:glycosyltransferase family 2 protein [Microbacterium atlanticum]